MTTADQLQTSAVTRKRLRCGSRFLITSEVLYQLSYIGGAFTVAGLRPNMRGPQRASVTLWDRIWTGLVGEWGGDRGRLNTRARSTGIH